MISGQLAKDKRHRGHVLQAVVAVRWVSERPGFGNDTDSRIMSGQHDLIDISQAIFHLRMKDYRSFTSRLSMKLSRESDLEKDILHHITAKLALETQPTLRFWLQAQIFIGVAK